MINFEAVKRKILLIDDDPEIITMLSRILTDQGFAVAVAANGREGIEKVRSEFPELVLLDLKLPDATGKEILKKIREINEDISTIVITGLGGEKVAIDLMKAGAVDFISKPFEMTVLLKSIEDALTLQAARLEDKRYGGLSSMERFFPFLAHEIRNPLHAVTGALAVIERRVNSEDEILCRSMKIIKEEVEHLTDFVQDCLHFVRLPAAGYFVEGDLNEMISIVMNLIAHILEDLSHRIKVTYLLDPNLPRVFINYEEIKQVFLNLVKNSFESMTDGGELIIETRLKRRSPVDSVVVALTDSGSGIRKENMNRLFEPFFTTKLRGSGLGLAICRRIVVERHKGRIEFESEEGKGTKVIVELPLLPSQGAPGGKSL